MMTVNEAYRRLHKKFPGKAIEYAVDLEDRYVFSTTPRNYNYEQRGPIIGGLVYVLKSDGSTGEFFPPDFPEFADAYEKRLIPPEYFV